MLPADWLRRCDRERRLAPLTTWRIGGPAEFYLEPHTVEELAESIGGLRRIGLPYRIIGGGSNLLISDRGVRGAVISLARLNRVSASKDTLVAEAGAQLHSVVRIAASMGLAGAEALAGIPGRVGGAVYGNAGGKYGNIGSLIKRLDLLDSDGSVIEVLPAEGFFRYRGSEVGDRIVLRAELTLEPATVGSVRKRSLEVIRERRGSQPGWVGNAGCVFRNPDARSAGWLIDNAGCKEERSGGVFVSPRHANFFENDGTGCAEDVRRLVERVRDRVRVVHGVELEIEVRRWV